MSPRPEERRTSPRIRAYLPARLSQSGRAIETLTKDLGMGGVRCLSAALAPVGTEVTVELTLPTSDDVLVVSGRTVWFQILPESEQFDIGIAFRSMPEQTKRLLSTYLEESSRNLPA